MVGAMDVEWALGGDSLRCRAFKRTGDLRGVEEGPRIFIRFEHFPVHLGVAVLVAAVAAGEVDQHFPFGNASHRVESYKAALELKGAMGRMRVAAQRPVDLRGSRIQVDSNLRRLGACRGEREKSGQKGKLVNVSERTCESRRFQAGPFRSGDFPASFESHCLDRRRLAAFRTGKQMRCRLAAHPMKNSRHQQLKANMCALSSDEAACALLMVV